ncbi:ABC transporter permease subunit [Halorhabdus sp. BNX81]|uniref:ABC transporter permease n=1 Tax=Halorhabdus sp. BNX81 TaxID=2980181 RepID=UPI0023DD2A38|nr:ABC transporter permease subunit [Halorhabdus sp. BNX81]WEL21766.1 hypothetical protein HBNXHr_1705 [Halorhabdus sp. BNX81]
MRGVFGVAKADFTERIRDRRFLVVILASVYLGHLVSVGHMEMALGDDAFRGVHNAAWLGTNMAIAASVAIAVFGFYYTKQAISRDREQGPGKLIASSPISTPAYLVGKWLGTLAILGVLLVSMAISVVVLFFLRGTGPVSATELLGPFVLFTLPVTTLVAAVAILFETIPVVRGWVGNLGYILGLAMLPVLSIDPLGVSFIVESMQQSISAQYPGFSGSGVSFGFVPGGDQRFTWEGVRISTELLRQRAGYLALSPVLVVLATIPFDRLDPAGGFKLPVAPGSRFSLPLGRRDGSKDEPEQKSPVAPIEDHSGESIVSQAGSLSTATAEHTFRPRGLLLAEVKLALSGRSRLWYAGFLGLLLGGIVAPVGVPLRIVLTLSWIWPLFIWSQIGVRERRHNTEKLVFTSKYPLAQLLAAWGASVVTIALLVAAPAIRMVLAADPVTALGLIGGVVVVPSVATASGVLSRTPRLFEIGYFLIWYVGIVNATPVLDFGGVVGPPPASVFGFFGAGIIALIVAVLYRTKRIKA